MKRVTISIPDDLEAALQRYAESQEVRPALTVIIQAALREYLSDRDIRPSRSLRITPARKGSGKRDVSVAHDRYLAEE